MIIIRIRIIIRRRRRIKIIRIRIIIRIIIIYIYIDYIGVYCGWLPNPAPAEPMGQANGTRRRSLVED